MSSSLPVIAAVLLCALGVSGCTSWSPSRLHTVSMHPEPLRETIVRYSIDGWLLTIRTDPFTGEAGCTLVDHLGYGPDAMATYTAFTFRAGRRVDTSNAWYRLDDGPAHAWRDTIPALVDLGAMAEAERIDNPTAGMITLPREVLKDAGTMTLRVTRTSRLDRFDLHGAWPLLAEAHILNCRLTRAWAG